MLVNSMNIAIALDNHEQQFLATVFREVFGGGSTATIQKILGSAHLEIARYLRATVQLQVDGGLASIELTAEEWRVVYESINAVVYGLGPGELQTCTGYDLPEVCNINLKICVSLWGAYGGRNW
jgi:hypothetical protein